MKVLNKGQKKQYKIDNTGQEKNRGQNTGPQSNISPDGRKDDDDGGGDDDCDGEDGGEERMASGYWTLSTRQ